MDAGARLGSTVVMGTRKRTPSREAASIQVQRMRLGSIRKLAGDLLQAFITASEVGMVQSSHGEPNRTPHVSRPTEAIATSERMAALRRKGAGAMRDADGHVLDALASLRAAQAALDRPFAGPPPGGMKDGDFVGSMPAEEFAELERRAAARRARGEE